MILISERVVRSKTSYVAESSSWRSAVRRAKEEKRTKRHEGFIGGRDSRSILLARMLLGTSQHQQQPRRMNMLFAESRDHEMPV